MNLLEILSAESISSKLREMEIGPGTFSTDQLAKELLHRLNNKEESFHFDMLRDKIYVEFSPQKNKYMIEDMKDEVLEKIKQKFTLEEIEEMYLNQK
jgi:hypothetical protein